jgi:hypothetical protein
MVVILGKENVRVVECLLKAFPGRLKNKSLVIISAYRLEPTSDPQTFSFGVAN